MSAFGHVPVGTCVLCLRVGGEEPFVLPELCSRACAVHLLDPVGIAHLFPQIATDAEEAALRRHEEALMLGALRGTNVRLQARLAGSIFRQREERVERGAAAGRWWASPAARSRLVLPLQVQA